MTPKDDTGGGGGGEQDGPPNVVLVEVSEETPSSALLPHPFTSEDQQQPHVVVEEEGSTLVNCVFNFTNCIIGAGSIGLGGAIAQTGGLCSVGCIIFFGILTKVSLDMVIALSVEIPNANNSYEDLGFVAFGSHGKGAVIVSKTLYSFGCLIAYIVVIKDNFATAWLDLLFGGAIDTDTDGNTVQRWLEHDDIITFVMSATIILPLCLLRDMSPLSNLSMMSVLAMTAIVIIVIYIFVANPDHVRRDHDHDDEASSSFHQHWMVIKPGLWESLGTFVFTFVSQHTVHLAYGSLKPSLRTVSNWKYVSTVSLSISTIVSLTVGVFVYMTFWEQTKSNLFEMYPSSFASISIARILLCITMLLTFPLPFFTCREMIILSLLGGNSGHNYTITSTEQTTTTTTTTTRANTSSSLEENNELEGGIENSALQSDLEQPLLSDQDLHKEEEEHISPQEISIDEEAASLPSLPSSWLLLPNQHNQLVLPYHVSLTVILWGVTTLLAIIAPSLGDVLDLIGCATGTVIAFILPSLFSFRLKGYSHLAAFVLVVGGIVGVFGTFFSTKQLFVDLQ